MATEDKYDRQLRLWGAHGQRVLSSSRILVLGAGAAASESLKNLALPGIGRFVLVDGREVAASDVEENFFVDASAVGKSRARVVAEYIVELNDDVEGEAVEADVETFALKANLCSVLREGKYSLVIATQLSRGALVNLDSACRAAGGIPLIALSSFGYVGRVRISASEHCVVEAKLDPPPRTDLRLANPFPELRKYVDSFDLVALDDYEYGHTPYVVFLIKAADHWKCEHEGCLPKTFAEKQEFKERFKSLARRPWGEEENLSEAVEYAYSGYTPLSLPEEVKSLFADPSLDEIQSMDPCTPRFEFWIIVAAIKEFMATVSSGLLPLSGDVPDMVSSSTAYMTLQGIYFEKAKSDREAVADLVQKALSNLSLPPTTISSEVIDRYCKNARDLQCIRYRSVKDEVMDQTERNAPENISEDLSESVMPGLGDDGPQSPLLWYIGTRASEEFRESCGRYPSDQRDADQVKRIADGLAAHLGIAANVNFSHSHACEMVRYGSPKVELHNTGAILGGVAAQEAVKLLTRQYIPFDNTYAFNGIACKSEVIKV